MPTEAAIHRVQLLRRGQKSLRAIASETGLGYGTVARILASRGSGAGGGARSAIQRPATASPDGGPNFGWLLLAGSALSFGLAWACIRANQAAEAQGGCLPAAAWPPPPPGAEQKDCCPDWIIAGLVVGGVILAVLGLGKL